MYNDKISYDEQEGKYVRPVFDLYKFYHAQEPDFDILINCMSVGLLSRDDFKKEDGTLDVAEAINCGRDLMTLWKTDVSPEPFMKDDMTFNAAMRAYADETGVESAIDAYVAGVPLDDLTA